MQRDLVLRSAGCRRERRVVGLEVGWRSGGKVDLGAGVGSGIGSRNRLGRLASSPPRTLICSTMPASLWPATVHHASVDASTTPRLASTESPGSIIGVPVIPPSLRSWGIVPAFVTRTMTSVPAGTSIADGVT